MAVSPDDKARLGELLLEEGVVTHEEIREASGAVQGGPIAAALVATRFPTRADLAAWLAQGAAIPSIPDLRLVDLPPYLSRLVAADLCRKHGTIPLGRFGSLLFLAGSEIPPAAGVQDLRRSSGLKLKFFLADATQVKAAIEKLYAGGGPIPAPGEAPAPSVVLDDSQPIPLFGMTGGTDTPGVAAPAIPAAAVRISAAEWEEALRDPGARALVAWDLVFVHGRPSAPIRAS